MVAIAIPFNKANVSKCRCPGCSVQTVSAGVSEKMMAIKKALEQTVLQRKDIPGLYCVTGSATCQDIDTTLKCVCETCVIAADYGLSQGSRAGHFCRGTGPATVVDTVSL